ncbi:MAG: DDE-type integrase/transposase/recombinase, partial [Jatrophihabitans sp.]
DPFDLTSIEVRWQHRAMGNAIPHKIGRHVHHKARPDESAPPPPPTGIDYLRLVEAEHTAELAERVRYSDLPDGHVPGQLILPGTTDAEEASQ